MIIFEGKKYDKYPRKEQSELFIYNREGEKYLKYPFIVRPFAGNCIKCGKHFDDYDTKMIHYERNEILCQEHFGGRAYNGERVLGDPEGYLTYTDN